MSAVEKFPMLLSEAEEESSAVPPCFSDEGINVTLSALLCLYPLSPGYMLIWNILIVSLHPSQQSLPPGPYKTQHQRRRDPPLPTQNRRSVYGVF